MEIDEVGILRVPKIIKTFAPDEFLQLSLKLVKTNEYGNQHSRYFVLTNKRILLLDKLSIRRRVPLSFLIAITISVRSFEFVLHFKDEYEDDDLRLVSERRSRVMECIVKAYSTEFNSQLPSFQVQDQNLKKYVTYKQDRHKKLNKIPQENVKFLFYKPMLEENERKSQLLKVHQTTTHNKLLYSAQKDCNAQLNDFMLIRILNTGSIAQIVLVEHKQTKIQYAMKSTPKQLDDDQLDYGQFIKFTNYQCNPFLVKLEYCFESECKYFFIMQLLKCDLFVKLEEVKQMEESRVQFYACEVLLALEHIHQRNMIYGDLKPENILLDAVNHIQLCDFGYMRGRKLVLKGVYATPEYIAPETLTNPQNQQYYTDYWQFGVLLYELLYSHPPFVCQDQDILFDYILNCQLEFPTGTTVSKECQSLLIMLLQKEPKKRIGYNGGVPEIQAHEWFREVDWKCRYDKSVHPQDWRHPNFIQINQIKKQLK